MRLWAEVYNASGTGLGAVNLVGASITRRLDGAGSLDITVAGGDPAATTLLTPGRWVHIWADRPQPRRLARGVLQRGRLSVSGVTRRVQWRCTDALESLRRANTFRGLIYANQTIETVVSDLVRRVPGWSVTLDGVEGSTTQRFDGVTLLQALETIADQHGYHFRLDTADQAITFGVLGRSAGIRATTLGRTDPGVLGNADLALIEQLTQTVEQSDVVTLIEPVSGPADGPLTLRYATKNAPYTVQSRTQNGRTIYYLEDAPAVAAYGTIEKVVSPKRLIVPQAGVSFAAVSDILYDWAAATLRRLSQPQQVYDLTVTKLHKPLLPGDKIQLVYEASARHDDQTALIADIDAELWVLSMTERYGESGQSVSLKVSTIDQQPPDAVSMLTDLVEQDAQNRTAINVNVVTGAINGTVLALPGTASAFSFTLDERTVGLTSCPVDITRSSAVGASAIRLTVDGVEVPTAILWGPSAGLKQTVDIAPYLLRGVLPGEHVLTLEPVSGSGYLTVRVTPYQLVTGADV